ncbi:MAG: efflux RND transporter periplasmic adaptor subunit [Flavobacteriales bacterium]
MKRYHVLLLAIPLWIMVSCKGEKGIENQSVEEVIEKGDLESIKKKKLEINAQYNKLRKELSLLDIEIEKLDTVKRLPIVTTMVVQDTLFNHFLELQGNVETKKNIIIFPEYSGVLSKVYVTQGQSVNKGQILAKIDDGGLTQQLAQLKVQYQLARTTFNRQKRLWDQKIGSEIQFLQAKSNMLAQKRGMDALQDQIAKTYVKAPFNGVIDDVITEQGSVVIPGSSQLFRIVNLDDMYIKTDVPENYLPTVKEGTPVQVYLPVLGDTIYTTIRQVGNNIKANNLAFEIEIDIPNENGMIKPNLTAQLKINDYHNEKAILVPQNVVSENALGEQYLYVIRNLNEKSEAQVVKRIIKTGLSQDESIEILEGLQSGDQIINEGARGVKDGIKVQVKNFNKPENKL